MFLSSLTSALFRTKRGAAQSKNQLMFNLEWYCFTKKVLSLVTIPMSSILALFLIGLLPLGMRPYAWSYFLRE